MEGCTDFFVIGVTTVFPLSAYIPSVGLGGPWVRVWDRRVKNDARVLLGIVKTVPRRVEPRARDTTSKMDAVPRPKRAGALVRCSRF